MPSDAECQYQFKHQHQVKPHQNYLIDIRFQQYATANDEYENSNNFLILLVTDGIDVEGCCYGE